MKTLATVLVLTAAAPGLLPLRAGAEEGMWTFDRFPVDKLEQAYGFRPTDAWLEHVRLSSARLAQGCSGSFVSENGLVMTNHHCAHQCIQQLSTGQRDLVQNGFQAKDLADEPRCPALEVNQLVRIEDVTARMSAATGALEGQRYFEAQRAEMARIEKECQTSSALRCEVVSLYHGGVYDLYTYRRFQDVRLVFAPELAIAFFGGDPDNFEFPRYDLDLAFLRVYEGDRPARMQHWFRWSASGARDGELTFVSGNPGSTDRGLTVAELEYQRDAAVPDRLLDLAELRGLLTEYQRRGAEERRHSNALLFYVENGYKALRGRFEALLDPRLFASKAAEEKALKAGMAADPRLKKDLPAFDAIARAEGELARVRRPYRYIEQEGSFRGHLFHIARTLVRAAEERPRPNGERLREFRDSALPALTQELFSRAPIYDELEVLQLTYSLTKMREALGPDHPFVRKVLGRRSPGDLAAELVKGTRLADVEVRRRLWEGGAKAVAASDDPMIAMARRVDPDGRALRKWFEDNVEAVLKKNDELVARARFAMEGTSRYPDGTFTPRLSYGQVKGYDRDGRLVEPLTRLSGAFERATGSPPFELPRSWLVARDHLDLSTPLDFCTTNDITGGNSGSPVVDRRGEIVGLVFDGNIYSLGGDYHFDPALNRAVAVHSAGIAQALSKVYGARRILEELGIPGAPAPAASGPRSSSERGGGSRQ